MTENRRCMHDCSTPIHLSLAFVPRHVVRCLVPTLDDLSDAESQRESISSLSENEATPQLQLHEIDSQAIVMQNSRNAGRLIALPIEELLSRLPSNRDRYNLRRKLKRQENITPLSCIQGGRLFNAFSAL